MSTPEFQQKIKSFVKEASGWELANHAMQHGPQYLEHFGNAAGNLAHQIPGMLGHAPGFLASAGMHRLADAVASKGARSWGLLKPYYANLSREGIQAALTGQDMMPKYRRGIGTAFINPSVSGLADYEISKELAKHLIEEHEKAKGIRITSLDEIRSLPRVKSMLENAEPGVLKSELSQNFLRALNPKLDTHPVVEALKKPGRLGIGGMGQDNQRYAGRIGLAGALALGGGVGEFMHGAPLHGAAVNGFVQTPEYGAASALGKPNSTVAQKLLNFGINLKKSVLAQGKLDALRRERGATAPRKFLGVTMNPNTIEELKSSLYAGANQLSAELYNLGRDVGTMGAKYRDADPISAAAAGLPSAEVRRSQVDSAGDYVHQQWESPKGAAPANVQRNQGLLAKFKDSMGWGKPKGIVEPESMRNSTDLRLANSSHGHFDTRSYMDPVTAKPKPAPFVPRTDTDRWHNFDLGAVDPHPMDAPASKILRTGKVIRAPKKLRFAPTH